MNLLASFALGGFNPWAAGFGIGSLVLFGLVGLVAGPNLKKFDPDAKITWYTIDLNIKTH